MGVPVELKMVPGLKVGNRVKANATSIFTDEREIYLDLGPRGMKSMERLLRYWTVFPFSLFVRMHFCKYGTITNKTCFVNNYAGTECTY